MGINVPKAADAGTGFVEQGPFEMVPHWVLEHPEISGNAVRLYAVLRRYGNQDRPSWPARNTLARLMATSPSTVDRARQELVKIGALCFINRKTDEGDWTSNLYHVHWEHIPDCGYLTGGRGLPYMGDVSPRVGDRLLRAVDGLPYMGDGLPPVMNEPDLPEPDLSDSHLGDTDSMKKEPASTSDAEILHTFNAIWKDWPKRTRKAEALQLLREITPLIGSDRLIEAAQVYKVNQQQTDEFPCTLASWLRGGRWEDEYDDYKPPPSLPIYDPNAPRCHHGAEVGRCAFCRMEAQSA